jgi:hypothetical protein
MRNWARVSLLALVVLATTVTVAKDRAMTDDETKGELIKNQSRAIPERVHAPTTLTAPATVAGAGAHTVARAATLRSVIQTT